jgi:TPR repeat protein/AcrR family transcriptional regulator
MSVSQATTPNKQRVRLERGPAWHRSETRKAILAAAREMIETEGLDRTSLLRIAEKTGFAPPTVYAYFVRKADLISAIVADDLSAFARRIRDGFAFSPEPEVPQEEEVPVAPRDEEMLANGRAHDGAEDTALETVEGPEPQASIAHEPPVEPKLPRKDAPHSAEYAGESAERNTASGLLTTIEERIAQLEARRVDPWLERRLREFERMLSTLDERVGASPAPATDASSDGRLQHIVERLEAFEKKHTEAAEEQVKSLTQSIEQREAKLRQAQTELRTLTLEASGRLEALERDRELRALAAEMPAVHFTPHGADAEAAEEAEPAAVAEKTGDETQEAGADASYLAAARRAAQVAESLARAEEKTFAEEVSHWAKSRTRFLVTACAALGVVLFGAEFLLSHRAAAIKPVAARPPVMQTAKLPSPPSKAPRGSDFASVYAAALAGNGRAQMELGLAYLNGTGVAEDDMRASHFLEAAAASGEPVAQYWLATQFEHGKGERADPAEAIRWYEASALQGNLKAMYKLAVSYAEGWGTRQNYGEAARWFSRAAEYGFVNAQYNLGVLYERGFGVPQSLLDAYKWYALAAAQGDKDSAARVDALASQLTPEDLATAKDAVAAFKPETLDTEANIAPSLAPEKPHAADGGAPQPKG